MKWQDQEGNITTNAWRVLFVFSLGVAAVGGAAQDPYTALLGFVGMLYTGYYYVRS